MRRPGGERERSAQPGVWPNSFTRFSEKKGGVGKERMLIQEPVS